MDGILKAADPFRKGDSPTYTATVDAPEQHSGRWLRRARVCALFVGLTAVMTWPSALHLATHSVDHQDIFFNLWRMEWVRHALLTSPRELFNGNQFYPERGVLAYSDAMMVESLIALPLLSAGLPPMLVHNLLLLGVIAASGIGMFVLARYLWGNTPAAILAGLIFAFAPYRFSHFMHMELQWAVWMPWAFWAMQRTLDTGTLRYGLLTGLFMALQLMSSIYYGLFLAVILATIAAVQAIAMRRRALPGVVALGAGAAVLAVTAWVSLRTVPPGKRARRSALESRKCANTARSHRATCACLKPTGCMAGGAPAAPR